MRISSLTSGLPSVGISTSWSQRIDLPVNGYRQADEYSITWDGSQFSSGVYFLRMRADDYSATHKLTLIK